MQAAQAARQAAMQAALADPPPLLRGLLPARVAQWIHQVEGPDMAIRAKKKTIFVINENKISIFTICLTLR